MKESPSTTIQQTPELKRAYTLEQSLYLHRINLVAAAVGFLIVGYLTFFSDPVNYPQLYHEMFPGRLIALILAPIVVIAAMIPALKEHGYLFSTALFLGGGLMMAHLTGVMNNESSSVMAWLFISIIYCGIYPLPSLYSFVIVLVSFAYYNIIYFTSGYVANLDYRMTLINIGSASLFSLAFKLGISRIRKREFYFRKSLSHANIEIANLNEKLKDENIRMGQELKVANHIQTIVLPHEGEYTAFRELEIACKMLPAVEVGGDYFDTIQLDNTGIIAIGDVTDHGLHSGLIMMMVHTALRALIQIEQNDIKEIFKIINKLLFDFRLKTSDSRIMSLILLKYLGDGKFVMTGQHESLILISSGGKVKELQTLEYGMFAGLDDEIDSYLNLLSFRINDGDLLILYTDGITEAVDAAENEFGSEGIIKTARTMRHEPAEKIKDAIIMACLTHVGGKEDPRRSFSGGN